VAWLPPVIDACCVLAFVIIGRASHTQGETLGGIASTAWPFLAGLAIGWLGAGCAASIWRPAERSPGKQRFPVGEGVIVWLATVAVGMALRVVAGQGTAVAFIAVALAFLGLFLLGWRLLVRYMSVIRSLSGLFPESFYQVSSGKEFLPIGVANVEPLTDAYYLGQLVGA
jgi:hypothetical protein